MLNNLDNDDADTDTFSEGEVDAIDSVVNTEQEGGPSTQKGLSSLPEDSGGAVVEQNQSTETGNPFDVLNEKDSEVFGAVIATNPPSALEAVAHDDKPDTPPAELKIDAISDNAIKNISEKFDAETKKSFERLTAVEKSVIAESIMNGLSSRSAQVIISLLNVNKIEADKLKAVCTTSIGKPISQIYSIYHDHTNAALNASKNQKSDGEKYSPPGQFSHDPREGSSTIPFSQSSKAHQELPRSEEPPAVDGAKTAAQFAKNLKSLLNYAIGSLGVSIGRLAGDPIAKEHAARIEHFDKSYNNLVSLSNQHKDSESADLRGNAKFMKALKTFEGASGALIGASENERDAELIMQNIDSKIKKIRENHKDSKGINEILDGLASKLKERFDELLKLLKGVFFGNKDTEADKALDHEEVDQAAEKSPSMSS